MTHINAFLTNQEKEDRLWGATLRIMQEGIGTAYLCRFPQVQRFVFSFSK